MLLSMLLLFLVFCFHFAFYSFFFCLFPYFDTVPFSILFDRLLFHLILTHFDFCARAASAFFPPNNVLMPSMTILLLNSLLGSLTVILVSFLLNRSVKPFLINYLNCFRQPVAIGYGNSTPVSSKKCMSFDPVPFASCQFRICMVSSLSRSELKNITILIGSMSPCQVGTVWLQKPLIVKTLSLRCFPIMLIGNRYYCLSRS